MATAEDGRPSGSALVAGCPGMRRNALAAFAAVAILGGSATAQVPPPPARVGRVAGGPAPRPTQDPPVRRAQADAALMPPAPGLPAAGPTPMVGGQSITLQAALY